MATIGEDLKVTGTVTATALSASTASITGAMCSANMALARTKLAQDTLAQFTIPWTLFRVHDAIQTMLPGTAAADDLAIDGDTFGTGTPHATAGDLKAAGATTRYARVLYPIPVEYDDGETINIRIHGGMQTTVSDTSATVDIECYKSDEEAGASADLCTTAATTINSLTFADVDFTITPTGVVSGDVLDIRIAVAVNDAATGTAVEATLGVAKLLCDIKG